MDLGKLKRKLRDNLPVGVSTKIIEGLGGELSAQKALRGNVNEIVARFDTDIADSQGGPAFHPRQTFVVTRYDSWAEKSASREAAQEAFDRAGIDYVLLPTTSSEKIIVLPRSEKMRALRALAHALPAHEAWHLTSTMRAGSYLRKAVNIQLVQRNVDLPRGLATVHELYLFSNKAAESGVLVGRPAHGVTLSFWEAVHSADTPRADGGTHVPGTLLAPNAAHVAAYLSPVAWREAKMSPDKTPREIARPHIYQMTEPIDVVYTWVNGADPAWLERKNAALGGIDPSALNETATSESRFLSRNELRYSLRSIEMYANWVRNIYIVTDQQTPEWLATGNPRLHVVDHRDIFKDPSVLPVFNSHAIESQLHHINGLSEHFIYLNDDVFFGMPTAPEDFFLSNGIGKYFPSKAVLDVDPPSARDLPVLSAAKRARELLSCEFGVTLTNKFRHTPMPLRRSVLSEMENRFADIFDAVSRSKFRHPKDYSIPSGLYHFYAYETGRAVPSEILYGYQDLSSPTFRLFLAWLANRRPYNVFCLNDTNATPEQTAKHADAIVATLAACYPFTSRFER